MTRNSFRGSAILLTPPTPSAIVFEVEAWDMNCPRHIRRRLPEATVAAVVDRLQARIRELEAEVAGLRADRERLEPE